jgi:hypothetical protein
MREHEIQDYYLSLNEYSAGPLSDLPRKFAMWALSPKSFCVLERDSGTYQPQGKRGAMSPRVFTVRQASREHLNRFEVQMVYTRTLTCTVPAVSATVARDFAQELYDRCGRDAFTSSYETLVRIVVTPEEDVR